MSITILEYAAINITNVNAVRLNGQRVVIGILRGFDPFMNLVLDEAHEVAKKGEKIPIGMVVIRGNSVVLLEALDRI